MFGRSSWSLVVEPFLARFSHDQVRFELRAALAAATREWVRGRVHTELGKLADLSGDRPRALDEYSLSDRLCRGDRDDECSDEARRLMKAGYR